MDNVDVTVYYLEMLAPPTTPAPAAPRGGLTVEHVVSPSVTYYRALYDAVGREYCWLSRRKLSDEQLATIIGDPLVEVHVLHVDGRQAGYAELDRRKPNEIQLPQFGLIGEFIGQGLGRWFLRWTIDKAWSYAPSRFWLHTCTLDHPTALPNYQKRGFRLYKQEAIRREL
jgi:GNAT superfamily N-acetyltransferase